MSRGPGRWQRAILDALQAQDYISLWYILPRGHTRGQRFACRRAAQRLAQQGRVTIERVGIDELYVTPREISPEVSQLGAQESSPSTPGGPCGPAATGR
jgi:hypothetical protein